MLNNAWNKIKPNLETVIILVMLGLLVLGLLVVAHEHSPEGICKRMCLAREGRLVEEARKEDSGQIICKCGKKMVVFDERNLESY